MIVIIITVIITVISFFSSLNFLPIFFLFFTSSYCFSFWILFSLFFCSFPKICRPFSFLIHYSSFLLSFYPFHSFSDHLILINYTTAVSLSPSPFLNLRLLSSSFLDFSFLSHRNLIVSITIMLNLFKRKKNTFPSLSSLYFLSLFFTLTIFPFLSKREKGKESMYFVLQTNDHRKLILSFLPPSPSSCCRSDL